MTPARRPARAGAAAAGDRGLTLLELVAVLAIFAMVAVAGLQAVTAAVRARDRIGLADAATTEIARALTLLRADLKALADQPFLPPGAGAPAEPAFLARPEDGWFALSVAGQAVLPGVQAAGLARVIWRLDRATGRLTRRVWPVLRPADARAAGPEVVLLDDVRALGLRVRPETGGWQPPAAPSPALQRPGGAPALPRAIEVTLHSARHGPLVVVVSY